MRSILFEIILFLVGILSCSGHRNRHRPQLSSNEYRGVIDGNTVNVILNPPLFAHDKDSPNYSGKICDFELTNEDGKWLPFGAFVLDVNLGQASIQLKDDVGLLDCKNQSTYEFYVAAVDCGWKVSSGKTKGRKKSKKSKVQVKVIDINEHDPIIVNSPSSITVHDNININDSLLRLEARDEDCGEKICGFHIINDQKYFNISNTGEIYSLKSLKVSDIDQKFDIEVVARDCRGKSSKIHSIEIYIKKPCIPGWKNLEPVIPINSDEKIFQVIKHLPKLETCTSFNESIEVEVTAGLQFDHKENFECTPQLLKQTCARRKNVSEILSIHKTNNFSSSQSYQLTDKDFITKLNDKKSTFLNNINWDGTTQVSFMMELFDISLSKLGEKRTILCKSDESGHNRHHIAIYVQNCHLMLLIRKKPDGYKSRLDIKQQNPAEWHWKLNDESDGNCNNIKYEVLLNIDYPNVSLYINNVSKKPFLIADDYPLHLTKDSSTVWSVGAAWEGKQSVYNQHFNGIITRLLVSQGKLMSKNERQCLAFCQEGIKFLGLEKSKNVIVSKGYQETKISENLSELPLKMGFLKYKNSLKSLEVINRTIILSTKLNCPKQFSEDCPKIKPVPIKLQIQLDVPNFVYVIGLNYKKVVLPQKEDVYPFQDVLIRVKSSKENKLAIDSKDKIRRCEVTVKGENFNSSSLHLNKKWIKKNSMTFKKQKKIYILSGRDSTLETYQEGLRSILIKRSSSINKKSLVFDIQCIGKANSLSKSFSLKVDFKPNNEESTEPSNLDETTMDHYTTVETKLLTSTKKLYDVKPTPPKNQDHIKVSKEILKNKEHPTESEPNVEKIVSLDYDLNKPQGLLVSNNGKKASNPIKNSDVNLKSKPIKRYSSSADHKKDQQNAVPFVVTGICVVLFVVLAIAALIHSKLHSREVSEDSTHPLTDDVAAKSDDDMDWDDSAMTITVNPLIEDPESSDFSDFDEDSVVCFQNNNNKTAEKNLTSYKASSSKPIIKRPSKIKKKSKNNIGSDEVTSKVSSNGEKCLSDDYYEWDP